MSAGVEAGLLHRANALGETLRTIRCWLDQPHVFPIADRDRTALERSLADLESRVRQVQAEPALLTVVLLGGTGVGKSSLLNALAGSKVADTGIVRPTTQYATVYHHREVPIDRLDPQSGNVAPVAHDRQALRYKVLVDTPDIDGNVLEHHQRLRAVLPIADAVLYVGSQEKYHDREGWSLLLEQRAWRGFAFVLNKWDRCLNYRAEKTGQAPDEDFEKSLADAGFAEPIVFRTCAGQWAARRLAANNGGDPIEDDFPALERWLEEGLNDRAIADIKVRGVAGKLDDLAPRLERILPPDMSARAVQLKKDWETALREAIREHAALLTVGADSHAADFERHFARLGRGALSGLFGLYFKLFERLSRFDFKFLPSFETGGETRMQELARLCVAKIPSRQRQQGEEMLHDRLLALADRQQWPLATLEKFLPADKAELFGEHRLASVLASELTTLEREIAEPTGGRLATRVVVRALCNWLPVAVIAAIGIKWLYDQIMLGFWGLGQYMSALVVLALVFACLHLLLVKSVPVRWPSLRARLERLIEDRLVEKTLPIYSDAIDRFVAQAATERAGIAAALEALRQLRAQLQESKQPGEQTSMFAGNPIQA